VTVKKDEYRIRSGDTLHGIAFRYGLDHRDLARWNGIKPPYVIYPDQVLKLTGSKWRPEPSNPVTKKPPVSVAQPAKNSGSDSTGKPAAKPPAGSAATPKASSPPIQSASKQAPVGDPNSWVWPTDGRILRGFLVNDPARNGLDIAGREGQEIKASAGGTVVYSGNGLIGFGELIIIKHNDRMLSAYAHNRRRIVAEGEEVKQGQKIAELGRNDRNEQILHFEIRVNGRPVDPRKYLPVR
jgi:lipoprotein NlpD